MAAFRKGPHPSGRDTLREVRRRLERGWPPGLTVLTGEDLFHLDRAQRLLLEALAGADPSGLGLTVWSEGKVEVERVVEGARSAGMFSRHRVVFVRDVAVLEGEPDPLRSYASAPPAGSFLLVRAPRLDARRSLHKALVESGTTLSFGPLRPVELLEAAAELEREKEVPLDREARVFLVDACAGDLQRVESELEKLRAFAGGACAGRLGIEMVRQVASGGAALSGWELSNAIEARDRGAALEAARRLLGGAQEAEEPLRVLGGLAYRARMLLRVRALVAAGSRPVEASAAVRGFPDERLAAAAMRYDLGELLALPARLLEADRALKVGSLPPLAVFVRLVEQVTAPAGPAARAAS